jgi:hypothetical protein
MGFFSDLLGSSNHSQTTTSTSNVTNTQLAGGNIGGPATYGTGNTVYSVATDQGTVQAATDISGAALELGATEATTGAAVAIAGLAHASDAYTSSLALVGDVTSNALNNNAAVSQSAIANAGGAIDSVGNFAGKALDSVSRFSSSALDSNTYIAGKSLDSQAAAFSSTLSTLQNSQSEALSTVQNGFTGALDQVNSLAQQVSQSATQTTDDTVQKIVLYIALAAGIFFLSKAKG